MALGLTRHAYAIGLRAGTRLCDVGICDAQANVGVRRSLSSSTVLSPTLHRNLTTSTITVVTIFILFTLYNLRDTRTAPDDSLVLASNRKEDAAMVLADDATKSTSSLLK